MGLSRSCPQWNLRSRALNCLTLFPDSVVLPGVTAQMNLLDFLWKTPPKTIWIKNLQRLGGCSYSPPQLRYTEKSRLLHFSLTSQIGAEHPGGVASSASVAAIGHHLITHLPLVVLNSGALAHKMHGAWEHRPTDLQVYVCPSAPLLPSTCSPTPCPGDIQPPLSICPFKSLATLLFAVVRGTVFLSPSLPFHREDLRQTLSCIHSVACARPGPLGPQIHFLSFPYRLYTVALTSAGGFSQAPSSAWLASGFTSRKLWWRMESRRKGEGRVFLPHEWYFQQGLPFLSF